MKFLVTVTRKDTPHPPEIRAELLAAQARWLKERVADGTLDCVYGFVEGGGVAIANAGSPEELNRVLLDQPVLPISDVHVRPLADVQVTLEAGVEALRRGAAVPV